MSSASQELHPDQCADAGAHIPRSPLRRFLLDRRRMLLAELNEVRVALKAIGGGERTPSTRTTIKSTALALIEGSPEGLTSAEVVFGMRGKGLPSTRESVTPQLSRLKAGGALVYLNGRWLAARDMGSRVAAQVADDASGRDQ